MGEVKKNIKIGEVKMGEKELEQQNCWTTRLLPFNNEDRGNLKLVDKFQKEICLDENVFGMGWSDDGYVYTGIHILSKIFEGEEINYCTEENFFYRKDANMKIEEANRMINEANKIIIEKNKKIRKQKDKKEELGKIHGRVKQKKL